MKSWKECCDEVGYRREEQPYVEGWWVSYTKGVATHHRTKVEAYAKSNLVEWVANEESQKIRDEFVAKMTELEDRAYLSWIESLRKEYADLPDTLFAKCLAFTYNQHHSGGYDEIAANIDEIVEFALHVIELTRGVYHE